MPNMQVVALIPIIAATPYVTTRYDTMQNSASPAHDGRQETIGGMPREGRNPC